MNLQNCQATEKAVIHTFKGQLTLDKVAHFNPFPNSKSSYKMPFYVLKFHDFFDGLIGYESLQRISAVIESHTNTLRLPDISYQMLKKFPDSKTVNLNANETKVIEIQTSYSDSDFLLEEDLVFQPNVLIHAGVYTCKNNNAYVVISNDNDENISVTIPNLSVELNNFETGDCPIDKLDYVDPHLFNQIRSNHLNREEKLGLFKVLSKNKHVFHKEGDSLTFSNAIKHNINTKNDIINPLILSKQEIDAAISQINQTELPFFNIEEALNYAKIKIAVGNKNNLLYIISLPTTSSKTLNMVEIRANNRMKRPIKLIHHKILQDHEKIFSFEEKYCNYMSNIILCDETTLTDISETSCIPKLFTGENASCQLTSNKDHPVIEKIQEGIIILNNYENTIETDCNGSNKTKSLNGTFVIKFHNCTVNLNGQIFQAKIKSNLEPQQKVYNYVKDIKHIISLETLHELHMNNTKTIETLERNEVHHRINIIIINASLLIIIIIIPLLFCRKQHKTVVIQKQAREGRVNTPELHNSIHNSVQSTLSQESGYIRSTYV